MAKREHCAKGANESFDISGWLKSFCYIYFQSWCAIHTCILSRMGKKRFKLFAKTHAWKTADCMCVRMRDYMHEWVNTASCEVPFLPSYRSRHSICKLEHISAKICLNLCISRELIIKERCSFAACLKRGTEVPRANFRWCVLCFLWQIQIWTSWSVYTWRVGMCALCTWVTRSTQEHEQVSAEAGIYTLVKHH